MKTDNDYSRHRNKDVATTRRGRLQAELLHSAKNEHHLVENHIIFQFLEYHNITGEINWKVI